MKKAKGDSAGPPNKSAARKKKDKKMQAGAQKAASKGDAPKIDPQVQLEIGRHLRAHYDDVVSEPVPDRFMELLEKLERSMARKS